MIVHARPVGTWLTELEPDDPVSLQFFKMTREQDDAIDGQIVNYAGRSTSAQ